MFRCDLTSPRRALLGLVIASLGLAAVAQVPQRNFPPHALRGEIAFGQPPEITVNGVPARLAPGARVRGQNNMLQMTASLAGGKAVVNYTIDNGGQVFLVWILNDAEIANKPWPSTPQQAQQWRFDPIAQVWSKP